MYTSRWADTPPSGVHREASRRNSTSNEASDKPPPQVLQDDGLASEVLTPPNQDLASQEMDNKPITPAKHRTKKRVPWKGKNIVISIPRDHFNGLEHVKPLSFNEVLSRLRSLESSGYHVGGFDLDSGTDDAPSPSQSRPIFPDEAESCAQPAGENMRVSIPNPKHWSDYVAWLTEQKLKALGVSTGLEEPAPAASDMSRQSSGPYPALPFSPPIPTGSAQSFRRPGVMRSQHSHHASMASPISPLSGPFGHMRAQSTYTLPFGFPGMQPAQQVQQVPQQQQQQQEQQQRLRRGIQPFSPPQVFNAGGVARGGSPAQAAAMRLDLGSVRPSGSPLQEQMTPLTPQDYSRGLVEDHRRRQHIHSISIQPGLTPSMFSPQAPSLGPTPVLPELPDGEDEENQHVDHHRYVPPQRREQLNANIAVPMPHGHRHNISEGLEREIRAAEDELEKLALQNSDGERPGAGKVQIEASAPHGGNNVARTMPQHTLDLADASRSSFQPTARGHKKSASRFNVAAPAFEFNPGASSTSKVPALIFGAPTSRAVANASVTHEPTHGRQLSVGSFNATAAAFQPSVTFATPPKTEFSFSSGGPAFEPRVPEIQAQSAVPNTIVAQLPSIFGRISIPDIVRIGRKSKAVAIVRPEEPAHELPNESEPEDEDGRPMQSEDRQKRMFFRDDDGDDVPRFAEPTPEPEAVDAAIHSAEEPSRPNADPEQLVSADDVDGEESGQDSLEEGEIDELTKQADNLPTIASQTVKTDGDDDAMHSFSPIGSRSTGSSRAQHRHKATSSLSALAQPFQFDIVNAPENDDGMKVTQHADLSDEDEDEAPSNPLLRASPVRSADSSTAPHPSDDGSPRAAPAPHSQDQKQACGMRDHGHQPEPSFDEIDAVMNFLNQDNPGVPIDGATAPIEGLSPRSPSLNETLSPPNWERTDLPSSSPSRRQVVRSLQADSSLTANELSEGEIYLPNGWPRVQRLNKVEDAAPSDWSGMFSPLDEDRLQQRSQFFDSHVDRLVGSVVQKRLQPLENTLQLIQQTVMDSATREARPLPARSTSAIDSDADDEDDEFLQPRSVSQCKSSRHDKIKAAVVVALREQSFSATGGRSANELEEVHSALADMRLSIARAASPSLELEKIRSVVEEVLGKQSQATMPITIDKRDETADSHRRQVSELEGRLNDTLDGAIEEANHRRAIEERETETRRLLRLAEEELRILRDTESDKDARLQALEEERHDLHERFEGALGSKRDLEDQGKGLEAENEAMQGTLEEYRISSSKWRHEIDESKLEREDLDKTINALRYQVEERQESRERMHSRLEKLHADMATAAGQLMSEKVFWKARDEDQQNRIIILETKLAAEARPRGDKEEEPYSARFTSRESNDTKAASGQPLVSDAVLEETVRRLQVELAEQQAVAARLERDFNDAREAGRAEVHRTRINMDTDIETAESQVNVVRSELESEIARLRAEIDSIRMEADTAKARHELLLEKDADARRDDLRKVNEASSITLSESKQKHEAALQDLQSQHRRALEYAFEDRSRSEAFLHERLSLSDAKLEHFRDKILHLEEKLAVAKSAAQAAVLNAQTSKAASTAAVSAISVDSVKISPQALRESILVLQEQLQEREGRIERLQAEVADHDQDGPAKLKERDVEIQWLRELLSVRNEDLTELIKTLFGPTYDRDAVRDFAIRIRANLQMEQQEKERFDAGGHSLPGQALASLSNFASPKAVQLAAAIGKWRKGVDSAPHRRPQLHPSGLMTPPTSSMRRTPSPGTAASIPAPRLQTRGPPRLAAKSTSQTALSPDSKLNAHMSPAPATPPLLLDQSYDRDAEDSNVNVPSLYDEDEGLPDANAGAPDRSLGAELAPEFA